METSDTPFTQLKEYDTLSRLFSTIPKHVKSSMFGSRQEFSWTSISVSEKFIAIGTNVGVVFVYDRMKGAILHELSYQEKPDGVSCVRLISRVDDSIAVGHVSGVVVIYHLPSIITNGRKMRAFFVKDSHESHVTCLQWSLNAMKLFSGDSMGLVVCTEIDYESFTSRSFLVCRESHSIVQLDYSFQTLLVSTLSRSFLCHLDSSNEIIQIGQTERKCNGKFGAVFLPGMHNIHEASVFASRPGLRVWKATSRGTVESTLLFRDQITEASLRIMLQRDVVLENSPFSPSEERQFGCILLYGASCLLTYNGSSLYFVDRDVAAIICYHSNVGPILDVAVCGDEVYVLRKFTHRPLLRLSSRPVFDHIIPVRDKVAPAQVSVLSPMTPESTSVSDSMPSIRSLGLKAVKMKGGFVSALKEVGDKVQKLPVQSFMQMPFVGKTTTQTPAKNDVVASNHASGSETVKVVQVSTMDDVDGVAEQRVLTETSHENIICGALVDSQPSGLSDVREQVVLDSDIVVPVVVQFPSSELCDRSNVSEKFSSHNSGDSQGNNSVISENDSEVTRLGVNYGLAGRSDARVTVEKQSEDFVRNPNTQWDDSSSSAFYSASGTASVPDSAQRVFCLSPEEDTLDIVFSSKRNSAKRIKKQVSKQNSNSSKSVDTASIASAESIESERRVNITSFPSAELGLASTVEQPMAASSNSNDSALSTLVNSIDLDIDLGLLRNDQPILDFVPIPLLKSELLEKSLHPATHAVSEEVGDIIIPSSREILQDSSANGSVVKQTTAEIWRQSSSEDDFYSVYRSNKKTPVTMGRFSATHELIETRSASAVDNVVGSKVVSSKTSDLANGEVGPPFNGIGMSNQPSVEPVYVFDTDPLNTGNAMPDSARNIPFSRGISVDFDRPPCSSVTGTSCYMMADPWVLMPAPANILSIAVSTRYVWCVDHTGHMFYSALHGPGLQWFSVTTATAQQIRVSPSGSLIWRIDGGSVYAASGVTAKRQPWGTKWLEVARDVASISVDETVAWYVKIGGDVYMQKGLSRERPGYRAIRIESTIEMVQVVCRGGVVWGLTADRVIVVRLGINSMKEEGSDWAYLKKSGPGVMIASFDLSDDGTAWAVDVVGRLWFTTDVTPSKPRGSGLWWQVSLDQMNDPEATKALQLQPLGKLIGTDYGGLVSAGCNGVWLCPRYRDVLHICRGSFVGHRWQLVIPGGMWLSTKWKCVHPSSSQNDPSGAVWLVQSNGAMFCMAHNAADGTAQLFEVAPPEFDSHTVSIGANSGLLWCLLENGHVFIRKGIQRRCRQGLEWQRVNMLQLDQRDEKLCQVSVGTQSIWALSTSGIIYFRLGVTQPPPPYNPAWVPVVDDEKHPIVFSCISTSTDDKVIWAISRDHQVFARSGVCDDLLFGTHWSLVPTGCKMQQLACSNSAVYSVDIAGQPYVRLGIEVKNTQGLSWHKIPGAMKKVSVTPDDELWAINDDAQLLQQYVFSLQRKSVLENLVKRDKDSSFEDAEWILV